MNYPNFQYIYPPRPTQKCKVGSLSTFEDLDFVAQPKLNGSCSVLFLREDTAVIFNRHGQPLTNTKTLDYRPLYKGGGWMVLAGEYMNKNKCGQDGAPFNHKFIIFDILVYDGEYLIGTDFEERLLLLETLYKPIYDTMFSAEWLKIITDDLYMVDTFLADFKGFWERVVKVDMYEGFVLKRLSGKLEHGYNENNNSSWQLKCRKPTKNYTL